VLVLRFVRACCDELQLEKGGRAPWRLSGQLLDLGVLFGPMWSCDGGDKGFGAAEGVM